MSKNILGIDIAKRKLDVALIFAARILTKQFDNSPKGFKLLNAWLRSLHITQVHACLEATGSYGDAVALYLHEAGHFVSIVNPFRIKGYAGAKLNRNKTDTADARLIADFCLTQNPDQWFPSEPQVIELQALTRRIEMLDEMLQMEKNRLDVSPSKTKQSIKRIIKTLEKEIENLRANIKQHINQNPDLKQQDTLLQTIPGIGEKTSHLLLAEIKFSRYTSARQVAAFAGVTPRKHNSGTSLNQTYLSKQGNGRVRKALYFPAIVATRYNKVITQFASRLKKNGKTPMQIVCASIRKLLHIAFGVLKNKTPFNPDLAFTG
jgi:transposase